MEQRPAYSYRDDPAVPSFADDRPVVLFDGDCALCSQSARTILKHGPQYRLVPAQSDLGQALLIHYGYSPDDPSSMLLIRDGQVSALSEAVLRIAAGLPFPYRVVVCGSIIPRVIRDVAYRFVARNRRRIRGQAWCAIPPSGVDILDRVLG